MDGVLAQERGREHWDRQACDSERSAREPASRDFYVDVERQRYSLQPHILECHSWIDWSGKRVLEVGAGIGTDARQLIRAGARYIGLNIDRGSAEAAALALRLFALPGVSLQRDARSLDFSDETFDVVYAFGVLHVPQVERAVAEIERVLTPGGELLVMLYNRSSIHYVIEIMFLRRLGLGLLSIPGMSGVLAWLGLPRVKLERRRQLSDYPYGRVYGAREAEKLLSGFEIVRHEVRFFDHRRWGVLGGVLPPGLRRALGRRWGWHRILHVRKASGPRLSTGAEARS
jgi:SAM-dependent methyltransferase